MFFEFVCFDLSLFIFSDGCVQYFSSFISYLLWGLGRVVPLKLPMILIWVILRLSWISVNFEQFSRIRSKTTMPTRRNGISILSKLMQNLVFILTFQFVFDNLKLAIWVKGSPSILVKDLFVFRGWFYKGSLAFIVLKINMNFEKKFWWKR